MNLYNTYLLHNGKITICTVRSQTTTQKKEEYTNRGGGEGGVGVSILQLEDDYLISPTLECIRRWMFGTEINPTNDALSLLRMWQVGNIRTFPASHPTSFGLLALHIIPASGQQIST